MYSITQNRIFSIKLAFLLLIFTLSCGRTMDNMRPSNVDLAPKEAGNLAPDQNLPLVVEQNHGALPTLVCNAPSNTRHCASCCQPFTSNNLLNPCGCTKGSLCMDCIFMLFNQHRHDEGVFYHCLACKTPIKKSNMITYVAHAKHKGVDVNVGRLVAEYLMTIFDHLKEIVPCCDSHKNPIFDSYLTELIQLRNLFIKDGCKSIKKYILDNLVSTYKKRKSCCKHQFFHMVVTLGNKTVQKTFMDTFHANSLLDNCGKGIFDQVKNKNESIPEDQLSQIRQLKRIITSNNETKDPKIPKKD